jgi:hypothetical protein
LVVSKTLYYICVTKPKNMKSLDQKYESLNKKYLRLEAKQNKIASKENNNDLYDSISLEMETVQIIMSELANKIESLNN